MAQKYIKTTICNLISGSFFALLLCPLYTFAQGDTLTLASIEYEQGDYHKALSSFDKVINQEPDNATAYYYRANTLIRLGLKQQALLDYEQAYKLTNSPIMKEYCQRAILSLTSNTSTRKTQYPPDAFKQYQVSQSLRAIQSQSTLDKVRIIGNGELLAQDDTLKRQIKLNEMKRETEQYSQEMQNAFYYDQNGAKQSIYSSQQIQNYLKQRHETEEAMTKSIRKSVEGQAQYAKQRAQLTQESAANLESQLTGSSSPDGVRLDPVGTNLYVRNYDSTNRSPTKPLPKPPLELMAKEKTFK